jgi:hypothetical protein
MGGAAAPPYQFSMPDTCNRPQLHLHHPSSTIHHPPLRRSGGIALVITLLMLSVITFLAIGFLVMTRTNRNAVSTTLDQNTAKAASDAALSRAQGEIIARMMAQADILSYDYMASHNYISPAGFNENDAIVPDTNNVNYDYLTTGARMNSANRGTAAAWVQNIANLYFDPRPPVFVQTNYNPLAPADFRFWVDLNRNGQFETNGYMLPQTNGLATSSLESFFNGEPEWIGALQYPERPHSPTNRFLMRYAYLVAPIGKTLDLNYIHNYAGSAQTTQMGWPDRFVRDQGVGSWELNLGAYLHDLNTNYYGASGLAGPNNRYIYGLGWPSTPNNAGWSFEDAFSLLSYRYHSNYTAGSVRLGYPQANVLELFGPTGADYFESDWIDEFSTGPSLTSLYPTNVNDPDVTTVNLPNSTTRPWPGGNTTNKFYDIVQDLFDTTKSSFSATNFGRLPLLAWAATNTDSYNRYTFQRLLATMGTGSAPELQTYVYDPNVTNWMPLTINATPPTFSLVSLSGNIIETPPTILRTKLNINYNNSAQIAASLPYPAGPIPPAGPPQTAPNASPTNLLYWSQLAFFDYAADALLRSQEFVLTNQFVGNNTYSNAYIHFGINQIPVYNSTNASVRYNAHIHRMLQLAANIYDASQYRTVQSNMSPNHVHYPSVFRPLFYVTNANGAQLLYITGFTNDVDNAQLAAAQINGTAPSRPVWRDPNDPRIQPNDNVWGVPWVVGAVKGLPEFNQFAYATSVSLTRKLEFFLTQPNTKPQYTNQFYLLSVSNVFGAEAWNSYSVPFPDNLAYQFSNCVAFVVTNGLTGSANWGTNFIFTNRVETGILANQWPGWPGGSSGVGFTNVFGTNVATLPTSYFSPSLDVFLNMSNYPSFLTADKQQKSQPVYPWVMTITNRMFYALYDFSGPTPHLLDFVNLGPFGGPLNILQQIGQGGTSGGLPPVSGTGGSGTSDSTCWISANSPVSGMSEGVYNQMQIAMGNLNVSDYATDPTSASNFVSNLNGHCTNSSFDSPFQPSIVERQYFYLEANDPLVHYTIDDLTWPQLNVNWQTIHPTIQAAFPLTLTNNGTVNQRYSPWGYGGQPLSQNMTFVDPGVTRSDAWNFPTNKFPSIGWLGRVHRGTPWQTIFLKADADPINNPLKWTSQWVTNFDSYPTNDYALLDLFTAVPNDNAASGLLSINQTNQAAWSALFSGIIAFTNEYGGVPIDPTLVPSAVQYFLDTNLVAGTTQLNGINTARAIQRNGIFHHLGDILNAATLSIANPYLANVPASGLTDDLVERIPIEILGLLKVGQPQFVIYSWGQALRPKDIYLGTGPNFNLCTNYQITAEYLTRTVCHVVGDPFAANPIIQIDSKSTEPSN